jgi:hypothetical protein
MDKKLSFSQKTLAEVPDLIYGQSRFYRIKEVHWREYKLNPIFGAAGSNSRRFRSSKHGA